MRLLFVFAYVGVLMLVVTCGSVALKLKFDECMEHTGLGVEYCMLRTFE